MPEEKKLNDVQPQELTPEEVDDISGGVYASAYLGEDGKVHCHRDPLLPEPIDDSTLKYLRLRERCEKSLIGRTAKKLSRWLNEDISDKYNKA